MAKLERILGILTSQRVSYQSLIEVRIFKDNILHNLHEYQKAFPKQTFAPVLKSNAYGHGLTQVAKILDREQIAFFMVDSFYEAMSLQSARIRSEILILGYATMEQINKSKIKNLSFTIIDLQQLRNISSSLAKPTRFHLKIDTGMHRQGILVENLDEAIKLIKANPNILLEGLCSHFADADNEKPDFTKTQIAKWKDALEKFKKEFLGIKYFHISNTAGASFLTETATNIGRIGIGLYGFDTSASPKLRLKPALEMVSIITSVKTISKGEKVGYNGTYAATEPTTIATIPVGYNEGLDLRLSNKGSVKIKNVFYSIVGKISMNMSSIDASGAAIKLEDEVVVISRNSEDKNSVLELAKISGMTWYEVLVHIPQYLRRIVI